MKLRTSFFNGTVLKKDITRFAPVWGLYTVFMLMFILLAWDAEGSAARFMNNAPEIMTAMGVLNFAYAGLCAMLLFGDLFTARMCNMLHALPLRREGWFLTHLTAGLLFCFVPNTLGALVAAGLLGQYAYGAFLWLALTVLQYLTFFGLGTFSVMCAGSKLGAAAVYGITNFLSVLAAWLIETFYEPFLYGIQVNLQSIARFSPVVMFSDSQYIQTHYDNSKGITVLDGIPAEPWVYAGTAAGAGVVLLVLALLVYRRRALESAGDLISLKPVAPVFLICYTLSVGAAIFFVAEAAAGALGYGFLLIGLAVGFFTGRMLLEKKVNIFRGKNFLAFGLLVGIFAASIGLTVLDPVGITRYVPEADQVQEVTVSPYNTQYSYRQQSSTLTDKADVETVISMHEEALQHRPGVYTSTVPVNLRYRLKSGVVVERSYRLPTTSESAKTLQKIYSRPSCVLGTEDIETLLEQLYSLEFYSHSQDYPYLYMNNTGDQSYVEKDGEQEVLKFAFEGSFADQEVARGLLQAIYDDCMAGKMSQWWNDADNVGTFSLQLRDRNTQQYRDIMVYDSCRHTLAYLKSMKTK